MISHQWFADRKAEREDKLVLNRQFEHEVMAVRRFWLTQPTAIAGLDMAAINDQSWLTFRLQDAHMFGESAVDTNVRLLMFKWGEPLHGKTYPLIDGQTTGWWQSGRVRFDLTFALTGVWLIDQLTLHGAKKRKPEYPVPTIDWTEYPPQFHRKVEVLFGYNHPIKYPDFRVSPRPPDLDQEEHHWYTSEELCILPRDASYAWVACGRSLNYWLQNAISWMIWHFQMAGF